MEGFYKRVVWFLLAIVVCVSVWGINGWLRPVKAAATDPRLIQLEFEVSALQNQVTQLRNQISRDSSAPADSRPVERVPQAFALPGDLSPDAQFDNLATLVVEINRRVIAIERQLSD